MESFQTDLNNKVVLITGASGDIGRATALLFAQNGAILTLTGRNTSRLKETKTLCLKKEVTKRNEDKVFTISANLEVTQECEHVVQQSIIKFGKLDVLVNTAGFGALGSIETQSLNDYQKIMNVHCRAAFVLSQAAVPHLKKTKGNIVNISSVAGIRCFPLALAYSVSKAALDQMTKCMALELAPYGIRCNSVNPGVINTKGHLTYLKSDDQLQQFLEHQKSNHALGRLGTVDEVAKAVVFLASNALSGFTTGVILPVDGGFSLMCAR